MCFSFSILLTSGIHRFGKNALHEALSHYKLLEAKGKGRDAIVTETKPSLLLQHSCPDSEVSKLSRDSHQSVTNLEQQCREWSQFVYPCLYIQIKSCSYKIQNKLQPN